MSNPFKSQHQSVLTNHDTGSATESVGSNTRPDTDQSSSDR